MQIFLVIVPLSILLIGIAIWVFSWAVKSGQYDDLEGPAHSILYDDDADMIPVKPQQKGSQSTDQEQPPTP